MLGKASSTMSKADRDYHDEDDHRTMSRAAEIEHDTARMRGVQRNHRKMTKSLGLVGRKLSGKR